MKVFVDTSALLAVLDADDLQHAKAAETWRYSRRKLSLVDCASFEVMWLHGLEECFAFDPHFQEQGFRPVSC